VSPVDVLLIINDLNFRGARKLPNPPQPPFLPPPYLDASGDGWITPADALLIINYLNGLGGGEGEYVPAAPPTELARVASVAEGEADGQLLTGRAVTFSISTETPRADTDLTDGQLLVATVESTGALAIREGVAEGPHAPAEPLPERTIADWDDLLDDIAQDIARALDDELVVDLALNGLLHP
jgi:hypothetical protein